MFQSLQFNRSHWDECVFCPNSMNSLLMSTESPLPLSKFSIFHDQEVWSASQRALEMLSFKVHTAESVHLSCLSWANTPKSLLITFIIVYHIFRFVFLELVFCRREYIEDIRKINSHLQTLFGQKSRGDSLCLCSLFDFWLKVFMMFIQSWCLISFQFNQGMCPYIWWKTFCLCSFCFTGCILSLSISKVYSHSRLLDCLFSPTVGEWLTDHSHMCYDGVAYVTSVAVSQFRVWILQQPGLCSLWRRVLWRDLVNPVNRC